MIQKKEIKKAEDRYVLRKTKGKTDGKFKVKKFDPTTMKLYKYTLEDGTKHIERTYTKTQVEKLMKENDDIAGK